MEIRGIDNQIQTIRSAEPMERYTDSELNVDQSISDKVDASETGKQDKDAPMSEKEQQRRMDRLQDTLKNHNIEISYNEEVNRYAIKVLDADSKEVVKEIPSEKTLEMFARMLEIEGLLVDERR